MTTVSRYTYHLKIIIIIIIIVKFPGDFYTALNDATELWELTKVGQNAVAQKRKNHHNAEITRLLLILIEQPTLEKIEPAHFEFVERYISGDYTSSVSKCTFSIVELKK